MPKHKKLMQSIPPIILIVGIILIIMGIFYVSHSITTFPSDNKTITIYPTLLEGSVNLVIGIAISVLSYLLIYNKIGLARYFKQN